MNDESYLKLAIELAKKGRGKVSPNPLVGCIIVRDNQILGAGYHQHCGGNHAEINAIKNAKQNIDGSTLYVNLEPCSHWGKTPPCVDEIIRKKIKRVVVGTLDYNPIVRGNGVKKLKEAGIDVRVGVLEKECVYVNRFFFKYISKSIPYITLKIAQTLDGKIADINNDSFWISSSQSRRFVHKLRSEYDAVLIGSNTVIYDNPQLTVRLTEGRNPKRIIIDTLLKSDLDRAIFENCEDNLIIVHSSKAKKIQKQKIKKLEDMRVQLISVRENSDGTVNLKSALKELAKLNITSILVEGGQKIFTNFVKNNLYDDLITFISPKIIGSGLSGISDLGIKNIRKSINLKVTYHEKIGDDIMIVMGK